MTKFKPSWMALIVTLIAAWAGAAGIWRLMHDIGGYPGVVCLVPIVLFESSMAAVLHEKVKAAEIGDGTFTHSFVAFLLALTASAIQLLGAVVEGSSVVVGMIFAAAPLIALYLLNSQMSRYSRVQARNRGDLPKAPSPIEWIMLLMFRREAFRARRALLLDRDMRSDEAMMQAHIDVTTEDLETKAERVKRTPRRQNRLTITDLRQAQGQPQITSEASVAGATDLNLNGHRVTS